MKKTKRMTALALCVCLAMTSLFCSCDRTNAKTVVTGGQQTGASDPVTDESGNVSYDKIDVDIAAMSGTVAYSQVYNMIYSAPSYVGMVVRMKGPFSAFYSEQTGKYYPAVIIMDATACCSQGIEFELRGSPAYPEGYPAPNTEVTVTGVFEIYYEDGDPYFHLRDAVIET